MIVEEKRRTDHPRRPEMRLVGQHKSQRLDEMRRRAKQDFPLGQRFGNQPELVVFEIAKTAMNQLRALRRRMRGEIVALDQ